MKTLPEIDVLLGVYNGEKYLPGFLESLKHQINVKINLIISDDSSNQLSKIILDSYADNWNSYHYQIGLKIGPKENYFNLLSLSTSPYAAFADQDDIWKQDHLALSVNRLQNSSNKPALSFSAMVEFRENKTSKIWPTFKEIPSAQIAAMQNFARGCTIVINHRAAQDISKQDHKFSIMHDWWALLYCTIAGDVFYSASPEISYRLHENNAIGRTPILTRIARKKLFRKKKESQPVFRQLQSILLQLNELSNNDSGSSNKSELQTLSDQLSKGLTGRICLIFSPKRFRLTLMEDVWFRVFLILTR